MTMPPTASPKPSASLRTPRSEPFRPLPIITSASPENRAQVAAAVLLNADRLGFDEVMVVGLVPTLTSAVAPELVIARSMAVIAPQNQRRCEKTANFLEPD